MGNINKLFIVKIFEHPRLCFYKTVRYAWRSNVDLGLCSLETFDAYFAQNFCYEHVTTVFACFIRLSGWKAMRAEKRWHILLSMILLLNTSSHCMDSKEAKQQERQILLNLILQVVSDSQRDKPTSSRRITSGLFSVSQDVKFSSREKAAYFSNSRPIGKLI